MKELIEKYYREKKPLIIDFHENIDEIIGDVNIIKINRFSNLRDIYLKIKNDIEEKERKMAKEIIKDLENHTTIFIEGYSDILMDEFAKMNFLIFNFERRRNGYILTERKMKNGIKPTEILFQIPLILEKEEKNVVVIENINYLVDFWGVEKIIIFLNSLLSMSDKFKYIFTGRMIDEINTFFEKRVKLEDKIFVEEEGGIYLSEKVPEIPHIYLKFENGNVYLEDKIYLYGRVNFEVYDYLRRNIGKNVVIEGFENLEFSLGNEAKIWLKAVMDLIYPKSVILLNYKGNYFVKGRIFRDIEDFKFLNYPVMFLDIHRLGIKQLGMIGEMVKRGNPVMMTYNSFELVFSLDNKKMKKINDIKKSMHFLRI